MTHSLDVRLLTAAGFVTQGGIACDIGTDHAYLAAYLADNNISRHVFACDVAAGPLESARATVEKLGLRDKITLVRSDGLNSVCLDGVTDVIICGMGGELILDIILREPKLKNNINLILQPMTRAPELRRGLYENGFAIKAEKACADSKFSYSIINAEYVGAPQEIDEYKAYVGALDLSDPLAVQYVSVAAHRLSASCLGKLSSNDEAIRSEGERELELVHRLFEIINEA